MSCGTMALTLATLISEKLAGDTREHPKRHLSSLTQVGSAEGPVNRDCRALADQGWWGLSEGVTKFRCALKLPATEARGPKLLRFYV